MKRLIAALLCVLLLVGCAKTPREGEDTAIQQPPEPLPLPPALVAPPIPALSPPRPLSALDYSNKESDFIIEDWTQVKYLAAADGEQVYTGLLMDNTREGNSVAINLSMEQTAEFAIGGITLRMHDGKTSFLPVISSPDQYSVYAVTQFADLDDDGTEEIILFVDYHSSGGTGDLHVFSCAQGELNEIYTVIGGYNGNELRELYADTLKRTENCNGVFLYPVEQGIALRVFLYEENSQARHYGDALYRNGAWEQIAAFALHTPEEDNAYFHTLEPAFAGGRLDIACVQLVGQVMDIRGTGKKQDILRLHYAYGNDPHTMYMLLEAQLGVGVNARSVTLWRAAYPDAGSFTYQFKDLDGDGAEELFLAIARGEVENAYLEVHIMKPTQNGMAEILTYFNGGGQEEKRAYADTLFTLPNAAGLLYDSMEALNRCVQWADIVPLGQGYAVAFAHMDENYEAVAYSRIAYTEGVWKLLEQGMTGSQAEADIDLEDLLERQNLEE